MTYAHDLFTQTVKLRPRPKGKGETGLEDSYPVKGVGIRGGPLAADAAPDLRQEKDGAKRADGDFKGRAGRERSDPESPLNDGQSLDLHQHIPGKPLHGHAGTGRGVPGEVGRVDLVEGGEVLHVV